MADRQWYTEGVLVFEEGEEEYFVVGVQISEDQAAAPGGGRVMSSLANAGGLAAAGGIAGAGGGLAG